MSYLEARAWVLRSKSVRLAIPSSSPHSEPGKSTHARDRKSTRLNSSHGYISYAVFCLKKTEKMVGYCKTTSARQIIIATEAGMLHRLQKECPDKIFIPAPTENCRCNECRFMKMNSLEKLHDCMADHSPSVELSPELIARARLPIERMLQISALPNQD